MGCTRGRRRRRNWIGNTVSRWRTTRDKSFTTSGRASPGRRWRWRVRSACKSMLCLFRAPLVLCRLLPRPAFMVMATVDLAGLWVALHLLALRLVRLHASVEKGFFTPLFLRRKLEEFLMTPQATSEDTFISVFS